MFCRLCLKHCETLHSIINSKLKCAELTLIESLYWIFGVEVDVNDPYSKLICTRCENVVQYIGSYRTLYQGNQLILEEKIDSQSEYDEWIEQRNLNAINENEVLMDAEKNADLSLKTKSRRLELIKYFFEFRTTALQELIGSKKVSEKNNDSEPLVNVNEVSVEVCKYCSRIFTTKGLLECHYQTKHKSGRKTLKLKRLRRKRRKFFSKRLKEQQNVLPQDTEELLNRCHSFKNERDNRTKNFLFDADNFPNLNFMKQQDKHIKNSELRTANESKVPTAIGLSSKESQENNEIFYNNYHNDHTYNLKITEDTNTPSVSQIEELEEINESNEDVDVINSEDETEPQLPATDSEGMESVFLSKNKEKLSVLKNLCIPIPKCDMPIEFEQGVFLDPNHKGNKPGKMKRWKNHISDTLFKVQQIACDEKEIRNTDTSIGEDNHEIISLENVISTEFSNRLSKGSADIEIQSIKLSDNCILENDIRSRYKQLNLKDLCISMKRCSIPKNFNLNSEILKQKRNDLQTIEMNKNKKSDTEITKTPQQSQKWKTNFFNTFSKIKDISNLVKDVVTTEDNVERNLKENEVSRLGNQTGSTVNNKKSVQKSCNGTPNKEPSHINSMNLDSSENKRKRKRQSDNDETESLLNMKNLTIVLPRIDVLLKRKKKYNIVDKTCKPRSKKNKRLVNMPQKTSLRKTQNTSSDCMPRLKKEIICKKSSPRVVPDEPPKLELQVKKSLPTKIVEATEGLKNDYIIPIKERKRRMDSKLRNIGMVENAVNTDKDQINLKSKPGKVQRKKPESTVVSGQINKEMEKLIDSLKSIELKDGCTDNELSKNELLVREGKRIPYHLNKEKEGSKKKDRENNLTAKESISGDEIASHCTVDDDGSNLNPSEKDISKNDDLNAKDLDIIDEEEEIGMWRDEISNILSRLKYIETDDITDRKNIVDRENTPECLDKEERVSSNSNFSGKDVVENIKDDNNTEKQNPLDKEKRVDNNSEDYNKIEDKSIPHYINKENKADSNSKMFENDVIIENDTYLIAKENSGNSNRSEGNNALHHMDREDENPENDVSKIPKAKDQDAIDEEKGVWEKQISNILLRLKHIEEDDVTEQENIVEKQSIPDCLDNDEIIDSNSNFSGEGSTEADNCLMAQDVTDIPEDDNKIEKQNTSGFKDKEEMVDNLSKFSVEKITEHDIGSIAKNVADIAEDHNKIDNNSTFSEKDITEDDVFPMVKNVAGVPKDGNKIEKENSSGFEDKEKGIHDTCLIIKNVANILEDHNKIEGKSTSYHHDKDNDNMKNFKPSEKDVSKLPKANDPDTVVEENEKETWKKQIPNILSRLKQFEQYDVREQDDITEEESTPNYQDKEERIGNNTKFSEKNITEDVFPMAKDVACVPENENKFDKENTDISINEVSNETITTECSDRLSKGNANIEIQGIKLSNNCTSKNDIKSQYKQLNLKDLRISIKRCSVPKNTSGFQDEEKGIRNTPLVAKDIADNPENRNKIEGKSTPHRLDKEGENIKNLKPSEENINKLSKIKHLNTVNKEEEKRTWKKQIPNILSRLKQIGGDDVTKQENIAEDSTPNYQDKEEKVGSNTQFSEKKDNVFPMSQDLADIPEDRNKIENKSTQHHLDKKGENDKNSKPSKSDVSKLPKAKDQGTVDEEEEKGMWKNQIPNILSILKQIEENYVTEQENITQTESTSICPVNTEKVADNSKFSEKDITEDDTLPMTKDVADIPEGNNQIEKKNTSGLEEKESITEHDTNLIAKDVADIPKDRNKIEDKRTPNHINKESENVKNCRPSEKDVYKLPKAKNLDTVDEEEQKGTWKNQIPNILSRLKHIEDDVMEHNKEKKTGNFKTFEKNVRENEAYVIGKESTSEDSNRRKVKSASDHRSKESEDGKNSSEMDVGENHNGSKGENLNTIDEEEELKRRENQLSNTLDKLKYIEQDTTEHENVTNIPKNVTKQLYEDKGKITNNPFESIIRSRWSNITKGQPITATSETSNPSSSSNNLQNFENVVKETLKK